MKGIEPVHTIAPVSSLKMLQAMVGIGVLCAFLIVLTLTLVLRKQSPFLRLGLWVLLLVRLIVPTDLTFPYSGSQLLNRFMDLGNRINTEPVTAPYESTIETFTGRIPGPSTSMEITDQNQIENNTMNLPSTDASSSETTFSVSFILFAGWIVGVMILLSIYLRKLIVYHRVITNALPIEENHIREIFEYWKDRFKIKRHIRLVSSPVGLSPFTMGIIKPIIFLPQMLLQSQDKNTIESVIAHEMGPAALPSHPSELGAYGRSYPRVTVGS